MFKDEQGGALILAFGFLIFLLAVGGYAIDLAYQMAAVGELERSMEAAALAGAGKLGFNDSVFPDVRAAAQNYGLLNPYHNALGLSINLDANVGNAPGGDIVLGFWDGASFTPSLNGMIVNAVKCRWGSTIPTSFLRILGIQTLPIRAEAIATSNPPAYLPPEGCLFPVGLSSCFFNGATSAGCGATVTFISSSDQSAVGANTAAWTSALPSCPTDDGSTCTNNINAPSTAAAIEAAASGQCSNADPGNPDEPALEVGDNVETQNGMTASVYNNTLTPRFIEKYNASETLHVYKTDGSLAYEGRGWEVYVPVIDTGSGCPPGAVTGAKQVVGFTRFVITQVKNVNGECAVANHWEGNPWDSKCYVDKNGTATELNPGDTGSRGLYGYYDCTYIPSPPTPLPVPRAALATRLRLVKTY